MPDQSTEELPQPPKDLAEEAEERSAPHPSVVYEAIYSEGRDELKRSGSSLFFSGLAAGLSMGFSLMSEGLLRALLPEAPWRPLIAKLGYTVGFLIVVLGRQQLFTENTLTVVLPVLRRRAAWVLLKMVRLWAIVLVANLLGALGVALALGHTAVFEEPLRQIFMQIAGSGIGDPFGTVFLKGIFAGWLIALMVWLMPGAQNSRLAVIIIITWLIGVGNFAHVIAGSVDKLLLVTTGHLSLGGYLGGFLAPSLLGNILGGVSLVAALNHGAAGREQLQES
ncbi:MAG TPA: formate/nitrite transporter family protein [Myxococcales bacterium]|nr:formate/nitrite transporter family protein [Myxococcales bacterium]